MSLKKINRSISIFALMMAGFISNGYAGYTYTDAQLAKLEKPGKSLGMKFSVCQHYLSPVNFCSPENAKIIKNLSKKKADFEGHYVSMLFTPAEAKKAGLSSDTRVFVLYSKKQNTVYPLPWLLKNTPKQPGTNGIPLKYVLSPKEYPSSYIIFNGDMISKSRENYSSYDPQGVTGVNIPIIFENGSFTLEY